MMQANIRMAATVCPYWANWVGKKTNAMTPKTVTAQKNANAQRPYVDTPEGPARQLRYSTDAATFANVRPAMTAHMLLRIAGSTT